MVKLDITLNNDLLFQIQSQLEAFTGKNGGKIAPGMKWAFEESANLIKKSWQGWAGGSKSIPYLSDLKSPSARLAQSIKKNKRSDFDISVESNSAHMSRLQDGQEELDMKKTHPYGKKSRVSKDNVPYLIIPMRWGTPNSKGGKRASFGNTITQDAYNIIRSKNFKKSTTTGDIKLEKNYKGEQIERAVYNWGDKLDSDGNMGGMVRMQTGKSSYLTFRIISAKSKDTSWIRKRVEGIDIEGGLKKGLEPYIQKIMQAGIEQDLDI
ncbi:MAG: hypothetical protein ACRC4W_00135 [Treponemataceae bacterium]